MAPSLAAACLGTPTVRGLETNSLGHWRSIGGAPGKHTHMLRTPSTAKRFSISAATFGPYSATQEGSVRFRIPMAYAGMKTSVGKWAW